MSNNILQYLPEYLQEIREYKEICSTEDIELEQLENKIEEVIKEVNVQTASDYGLSRYEKIFNIVNTTTDIDERRFKVRSKLINQLPFNMKWLENKLKNLVGDGNYKITLDAEKYTITVQISHIFPDIVDVMTNDLREQLSANLVIIVNLFRTEMAKLYYGGIIHVGKNIKIGGEN